jgi:hypothetical protein
MLAAVATASWAGCTPARNGEVPPAKVKTIQAYGVTLDPDATPKQVAYVLLQALADNIEASQSHDRNTKKTAADLVYDLGAYSRIEQRLLGTFGPDTVSPQARLGPDRDRQLYDFTQNWAQIVGYYVGSFDRDLEAAVRSMQEVRGRSGQTAHVYYPASHYDESPESPARQRVTLDIELSQEKAGGLSYWRVARVGYAITRKPVTITPATRATAPATEQE